MKFTLLLRLVIKNMLLRKLRFFFTLLAAGIAVGATVFLFSLGYGIEKISTKQLVKSDSLLQIEATSDRMAEVKLNSDIISQIKNFSETETVATSTSLAGKLINNSKTLDSPLYAVSTNFYPLAPLELAAGRFPGEPDREYLLLSEKVAQAMGGTNETLLDKEMSFKIIVPPTLGKQTNADQELKGKVIGIIKNSTNAFIYTSEDFAQISGTESASLLKIKAKDKEEIPVLRKKTENLGLKTTYIGDTLEEMNRFFSYFRLILAGFGAVGIIIALLGMFNTLTVSLMERVKEVSLLKILGSSRKTIFWLFALESLIFGLLGFILGIILFLVARVGINGFLESLARRLGNTSVGIFDTPITLLITVFIATLLLTFLTGLFPARRALKVDPLDIQRYE